MQTLYAAATLALRRHVNRGSSFCFTRASGSFAPSKFSSINIDFKDPNPSFEDYQHSEAEARELFESWCKQYDKKYPSEQEKLYRFGIFRRSLEYATRRNKEHYEENGNCPFGTSYHADYTRDEFYPSPKKRYWET